MRNQKQQDWSHQTEILRAIIIFASRSKETREHLKLNPSKANLRKTSDKIEAGQTIISFLSIACRYSFKGKFKVLAVCR